MKNKILLVLMGVLFPVVVFAQADSSDISLVLALIIEFFVTIPMSLYIFRQLSIMYANSNSKKLFWMLFVIRIVILLFVDLFVTPDIARIDFAFIFLGIMVVVPVCSFITKTPVPKADWQTLLKRFNGERTLEFASGSQLKCIKCNSVLQFSDKFCFNCGQPVVGEEGASKKRPNTRVQIHTEFNVTPQKGDQNSKL